MSEELKKALHRAFDLGLIYWQQSDSEYTSQHKKADITKALFDQLVVDTVASMCTRHTPDVQAKDNFPVCACVIVDNTYHRRCKFHADMEQASIDAALEKIAEQYDIGGSVDARGVAYRIRSYMESNPLAEAQARIAELEEGE